MPSLFAESGLALDTELGVDILLEAGRTAVFMPDEVTLKSMNLRKLQALALDAEIVTTGLTMRQLRQLLLTVRATFDGRQFKITRAKVLDLHNQLYTASADDVLVPTEFLSAENAFYFWADTQVSAPTGTATRSPASGAKPLTVIFTSTWSGTVTRRIWSSGESTPQKSFGKTAKFIYKTAGVYTPTLKIYGPLSNGTIGFSTVTLGTVTVT